MTSDPNLQMQLGWKDHVESDGSNVGGCDPASYLREQQFPPAAQFYLQGTTQKGKGLCPTVEWYIERQIPANSGAVSIVLDEMIGYDTFSNGHALERDLILLIADAATKKTWKYNLSFDIYIEGGWKLRVSDAKGDWVDTGLSCGPLAAGICHHIELFHAFDVTKKTFGTKAVAIDGVLYLIPAQFQGIAAEETNWTAGLAILQVQQEMTAKAGDAGLAMSQELLRADLVWP
jgi:hypothetical protein